jgi:putative oxidoreductase
MTPIGASLLSGTMITAIRKVHAPKGPWVAEGGYEYNLVLIATVFVITDVGPGEWSLDEALGIHWSGPGWALAQLTAGAIGSTVTLAIAERQPPHAPPAAQAFTADQTVEAGGEETPAGGPDGQVAQA